MSSMGNIQHSTFNAQRPDGGVAWLHWIFHIGGLKEARLANLEVVFAPVGNSEIEIRCHSVCSDFGLRVGGLHE